MSALTDAAIARAGLSDLLTARLAGDMATVVAGAERLHAADLLVLGAMADRVRAAEVGADVHVYERAAPEGVDVVGIQGGRTAFEVLRAVALARLTGPRGARVRVAVADLGFELAQVALGFGANEIVGALATKRGLPIAEGATTDVGKRSARVPLATQKRRELESFVRQSGRVPVFA